MATRTNTELRVFLEGTLTQYNTLTDKTGTVFFDKDNHAIYAKGERIIQSNIKDVTYNESTTELTIIPFTGYEDRIVINLGIQKELDDLETTLETWVKNNYVKQVDGSRLMTEGEGTKLAGIDEGAQTNRYVTVNGDTLGLDSDYNKSTIKISGNLVTAPNNGEDSKIEFYLSHKYYPKENKIRFFKTATPPATYDEATNGPDVVLTIDTTDFVLAGMITNVEYIPEDEWLEITFPIINQITGERENKTVEVSLSALIDTYYAGNGLSLDTKTKTFSVNNGYGLTFEDSELTVDIDTDNGLKWTTGGKFGVDFTKAPVQSVNGQTGEVTIKGETQNVDDEGYRRVTPITFDTSGQDIVAKTDAESIAILAVKQLMTNGLFELENISISENVTETDYKLTLTVDNTPKVWQF